MNLIRLLHRITTAAAITKGNAEEDKKSTLSLSALTATYHQLNVGEKIRIKQNSEHTLNVATTKLFKSVSRLLEEENCCCDCCDCDNDGNDDIYLDDYGNDDIYLDDDDGPSTPTTTPTTSPTLNPTFSEKMITTSDGAVGFGNTACSISNGLVVIGAPLSEEAYLFSLDGTEVSKLEPGDNTISNAYFGGSVSMDEKIVVGTNSADAYLRVFSREGIYERTIRRDDCSEFGWTVATLGDKIVTSGVENSLNKLFVYSTEGELLTEIEHEDDIDDVAISEQYIVSTSESGKTILYSNSAPDFPKLTEIDQGGDKVAVSGDKLVIGVYLYLTDGTLVKELENNGANFLFGIRVDITDDYVVVGAPGLFDDGYVLIFSSVTGELIETVTSPNNDSSSYNNQQFGTAVCASDSYYVVGYEQAAGYAGSIGVYLFQFSS